MNLVKIKIKQIIYFYYTTCVEALAASGISVKLVSIALCFSTGLIKKNRDHRPLGLF